MRKHYNIRIYIMQHKVYVFVYTGIHFALSTSLTNLSLCFNYYNFLLRCMFLNFLFNVVTKYTTLFYMIDSLYLWHSLGSIYHAYYIFALKSILSKLNICMIIMIKRMKDNFYLSKATTIGFSPHHIVST